MIHIFRKNLRIGTWPHSYEMLCGKTGNAINIAYTTIEGLQSNKRNFAVDDFCPQCMSTPEAGIAILSKEEL